MTLEMLLEEEKAITSKIKESLKTIKEWFDKKMDQAKEIFEETKDKILAKLKKASSENLKGKKLKEDIKMKKKDGKEEVIGKKGDDASSVFNKLQTSIKSVLVTIKTLCQKIVAECQKGLRKLAGIDEDTFKDRQLVEVTNYKKNIITNMVELEGAVLAGLQIAGKVASIATIAVVGAAFYRDRDIVRNGVDTVVDKFTGGSATKKREQTKKAPRVGNDKIVKDVEYEVK